MPHTGAPSISTSTRGAFAFFSRSSRLGISEQTPSCPQSSHSPTDRLNPRSFSYFSSKHFPQMNMIATYIHPYIYPYTPPTLFLHRHQSHLELPKNNFTQVHSFYAESRPPKKPTPLFSLISMGRYTVLPQVTVRLQLFFPTVTL